MMELTQKDFEERYARDQAGTGDDEDRRLVKHYLAEGYTPGDGEATGKPADSVPQPVDAPAAPADGDGGDDGKQTKRPSGRGQTSGR